MIESAQKRTLVIVGNGFDTAHGCKTSFCNFEEYIKANYSDLHYYLESCATLDLWSDFERALGLLDVSGLYREPLFGFDMVNNDDDERRNHQIADEINNSENLIINGLKNALNDWILTIDVCKEKKSNLCKIFKEAFVITFNYTAMLEFTYGFFEKDLIYLHGKARERIKWNHHDDRELVSDLVVGHGDKTASYDINTARITPSDNIVLDEVETNGHKDVLKALYKDTDKQMHLLSPIFSNADKFRDVFIIGHSLSEIDAPYFKELIHKLNKNIPITITFYGEKDFYDKKSKIPILFPGNNIKLIDANYFICSPINNP